MHFCKNSLQQCYALTWSVSSAKTVAGGFMGAVLPGGAGGLHVQGLHGCPLPTSGCCRSDHRWAHLKEKKVCFYDVQQGFD